MRPGWARPHVASDHQQAAPLLAVWGAFALPELLNAEVPAVPPEEDVVPVLLPPDPVPDRSMLGVGGAPLLMHGELLAVGAVTLGLVPMVCAKAGTAASTAMAAVANRRHLIRGLSLCWRALGLRPSTRATDFRSGRAGSLVASKFAGGPERPRTGEPRQFGRELLTGYCV